MPFRVRDNELRVVFKCKSPCVDILNASALSLCVSALSRQGPVYCIGMCLFMLQCSGAKTDVFAFGVVALELQVMLCP